jgi:hypothetical protein
MEVSRVPVHGLLERPVEKPDVRERERTDSDGDLGWDFIEAGGFFPSAGSKRNRQAEDAEPDQKQP